MSTLSGLLILLSFALSDTPTAIDGRVVDARSGAPIAGAAVAIVGQRGAVTTDTAGRFRWQTVPSLPADFVVTLPGGQVVPLVRLSELDPAVAITLRVDRSAVSETLSVVGAAPTIDVPPGAATALLTAADLALRHPATLSQALDVVAGVSAISEGQAAVDRGGVHSWQRAAPQRFCEVAVPRCFFWASTIAATSASSFLAS